MGFDHPIQNTGIFPAVEKRAAETEAQQVQAKTLEGWKNYSSAEEENQELQKLVNEYVDKGLCHLVDTLEEAEAELGRKPIINKLGVLVKEKMEHDKVIRKSRIIWDIRRSGANMCCHQGERIILPRLLDLAAGALEGYRDHQPCWVAAIDIKDAFLNIPAGKDRFALTAAKPKRKPQDELQVFDTLVFGAASSPTVWGRFAAWLGRTLSAIEPRASTQIFVDDPAFVLRGERDEAVEQLTNILLWTAVAGGKDISWIGAQFELDDGGAAVRVSIRQD